MPSRRGLYLFSRSFWLRFGLSRHPLRLEKRTFSEPSPYNPPANLRTGQTKTLNVDDESDNTNKGGPSLLAEMVRGYPPPDRGIATLLPQWFEDAVRGADVAVERLRRRLDNELER